MSAARVVNFTFHGVGTPRRDLAPGEDAYWLDVAPFEAALDALAGRDDATITFDDGNVSDLEIALPRVVSRGLTASFFFPAGLLGHPGYLSLQQVRAFAAAGMTVGSHGMDHRSWIGLDEAALAREIDEAKDRLEQAVGERVAQAACPLGTYDRRSLARLRAAGFERVYTSDRGPARRGDWIQPRNTIVRGDGADTVRRLLEERPGALTRFAREARRAVKRWR